MAEAYVLEVVRDGTAFLDEDDRIAIATYLLDPDGAGPAELVAAVRQ